MVGAEMDLASEMVASWTRADCADFESVSSCRDSTSLAGPAKVNAEGQSRSSHGHLRHLLGRGKSVGSARLGRAPNRLLHLFKRAWSAELNMLGMIVVDVGLGWGWFRDVDLTDF